MTTEQLVPIIARFSINTTKDSTPFQDWIKIHFGLLHSSPTSLDPIIKWNLLTDIPKSLQTAHTISCTCYICAKMKTNKLPRGKAVNKFHLQPFERLHIDFSFYGVTSIRGFTSTLDIVCGATSYAFGFPTKAKTPIFWSHYPTWTGTKIPWPPYHTIW